MNGYLSRTRLYMALVRSGISVGSLGQFAGVFDIVENVTSTCVTFLEIVPSRRFLLPIRPPNRRATRDYLRDFLYNARLSRGPAPPFVYLRLDAKTACVQSADLLHVELSESIQFTGH